MSNLRPPMIWTGGALASLGLLLIILRLIGLHEGIPSIGALPILHYYGAAGGAGVLGMTLLLVAPQARRARARVRLDERPLHEANTLRPKYEKSPHTHGFATQKPAAPEPPLPQAQAPARAPAASPAARGHPMQTQLAPQETQHAGDANPTKSSWGRPRESDLEEPAGVHHPNDPHHAQRREAPLPAAAEEALARQRARRSQLSARLEELEQKANQAKVRYGLGKVSAAGYRQYLAEVDQERMMIETELMEVDE